VWYAIATLSVGVLILLVLVSDLFARIANLEAAVCRNLEQFQKFADGFYWVRMPENGEMKPFVMLAEKTDIRNVAEPLHHLLKALGYEWVPGGTMHTSPKLVQVQTPAKLVKVRKTK
jgi:hypothetical protein